MARILMISNSSWNLQHFRAPVIRGLVEAGHRVITVSPDDAGVLLDGEVLPHRAWTVHRSSMNPLGEAASLRRLAQIINIEKPDLVFSFTIKPNIYSAIAGRLSGVPVVPNVSGLGSSFLGAGPVRVAVTLLYKAAFRSAPLVFFQNSDDEQLFLRSGIVRLDQVKVVPGSGINLNYFLPEEVPSSPRFLMIARLLRDKGVREYVAAAAMLRKRVPDATFSLLGDLDPANPTGITAEELGQWVAEGSVHHLGSAQDVRPYIRDASVIVLPSYREGLPRALLEGAAMARPLIGTDVPGCRELVRENVTGLRCAPRDADALATAMERMATKGHHEWDRMGLKARDMVEREFDERLVVEAYCDAVGASCR